MRTLWITLVTFALAHVGSVAQAGGPGVGTSFTYQAELVDAGVPVDGSADFQFTLYDADQGGTVVGSMIQLDDVAISNGRFTVELSFGGAYDGSKRWLEVSVRSPHDPGDVLPFTTLSPRQKITASPYSVHALNTELIRSGDGLTNKSQDFIGINTDEQIGAEGLRVHEPLNGFIGSMYVSADAGSDAFYGLASGEFGSGGILASMALRENTSSLNFNVNGVLGLMILDDGNVGIGDPFPTEKLQVGGVVHSTSGGFKFPDGTTQLSAASGPSVGNSLDEAYDQGGIGSGRTIVADAGAVTILGSDGLTVTERVAVGHMSPLTQLDVRDDTTGFNVVNLERLPSAVSGSDILQIRSDLSSDPGHQFIECERGVSSDIEFRVWGDGRVTADGTITGGGADFAEMVKVTHGAHAVEAGDVLVVDPDSERGFAKSREARSTLVAGVYSTAPGFLGSEHDWDQLAVEIGLVSPARSEDSESRAVGPLEVGRRVDEIPLAVVGIVPCKVSAENGQIRAGDLLVAASRPGHAMRDETPRVGTVIGKALGSLSAGTGVIQILVTLQ